MSTNRTGVGGFGWLSTGEIPVAQGTRDHWTTHAATLLYKRINHR